MSGCDGDDEDVSYAQHIITALNQGMGQLCQKQHVLQSKNKNLHPMLFPAFFLVISN